MKKRLIVSIQLALGVMAPAQAANNVTGINLQAGSFTYAGGVNLTNSQLTFNLPASNTSYGTMTVTGGNYVGTGSTINMNTFLNAGGNTVAGEGTNRILISGDASGQTVLVVKNNGGPGASTDLNGNTFNDAGEGISLVQVAGNSSSDAFVLQGGYTAIGAYQYRLNAYQPGQSDPTQRLVPADADGHWDYRLQNAKVVTTPVPPVTPPGSSNPSPPSPTRPGLVPQAPSYLVHNNSLFAYGQSAISALHQRLGEVNGPQTREGVAEVYVRALGGDHHAVSSLRAQQYGYDYDQKMSGLQIGGNWLKIDGEASRLRLGFALSSMKGRTDPDAMYAVDHSALEMSLEKTQARSLAATATWEHGSGFYIDGVVGASRYRSDITTPFRAGKVAHLRSNDVFASVEAGYDWALGDSLTLQPQAQVIWQKLDTDRVSDADGVVVDLGTPELFTWRVGMRALFTPTIGPDGSVLTQYIKLNYYDSAGPQQRAFLSGDRFVTSEYGQTAEFGFGLTVGFKNNLSVYGDLSMQKDIGHASREGGNASVGLRWMF